MPMLGLRASRDEIDELFDSLDQDGSGTIEYHELKDYLESEANATLKLFQKSPLLAGNAHEKTLTPCHVVLGQPAIRKRKPHGAANVNTTSQPDLAASER